IDSIVYNLTDMLAGTRSTRAVVRLPLNFGRVGALAYRIATQNLEVRYDITFYMYDPTTAPTRVCATKLVPLVAEYATVSMYDCMEMRPGAPEIDPQTTVYRINIAQSLANAFGETFDSYGGFGTPITYVVKAGDIALLPSWYHKTSVAGSRIARIWIIAAGEQPCGTPALGTRYSFTEVKDDKVELKLYKFNKYLVVNFVPNVCPAGVTTRTYLDEFDGEGRIVGLGFGTSGTSALVISNYTGVQMWNSTAMWLAGGAFKLPTVALDRLTVKNEAEFPIVVGALTVRYMGRCTYEVPVDLTYVGSKTVSTTLLGGYGFGRTYMMNITDVWAFRLVQPNYNYSLKVYHAGVVDAVKYFGLDGGLDMAKILDHVSPLTTAEFVQNVLYASHAPVREWTYEILFGKISEVTRGTWSDLVVNSSDWDYKYVFSFPTLRLREIRDWNDRPLANQTVVLFAGGKPYAIVYTDSSGRLVYLLPDLRDPSQIVRVSWYYGYLFELLRGRPEFTIWIYDQSIERDRVELGIGTEIDKIRTYVYPLTITVRDAAGRPLTNMIVQVIDTSTTGRLVNAANKTGADGGAQVVDLRISKYATGVLSQVPANSYEYRVFDENGALVAVGRFEIQRGAAVPAQGWNIIATVQYVTDIPVRNSATRGYLLIRNVEFIDGSRRDVEVPFTISNGVMRLQGKVPVTVDYPVEIYITHVTLGNVEVPVRGGKVLVFTGRTGDLLAGLDFAELGVTGIVTIQAVDTSGAPRSDWTVQVLYRNITVAQGGGQVQVVLPRTDLLDAPYNVRVITNAITPAGTVHVEEQTFEVRQRSQSLQLPVSTVKATVQAVDGFGNLRSDWPINIVNVASGTGQIDVELVEGERYTVRVTGLGYTNETVITARGRQMTVAVKVPTAKITAQVVDGFDRVRSDWPIEIVNVVAASGSTGDVEVIAGCYDVKSAVFGKEFTERVCVKSGEVKTAAIKVPTAKLSITVVDDDRRPIDRYVTSVELTGPTPIMSATPPRDLEVLAGSYTVKVTALGKDATATINLNPGESKSVQIVVPGTAGLDFMGTRIPLPTLVLYALLLLVVVAILVILMIEYNNWRRRRLMQILAPPK
ncbi:MAG: Ig-like domain-containing protein, partial [Pyrobaculum sp.]